MPPYKLSVVLDGHTQDVRCVASTSSLDATPGPSSTLKIAEPIVLSSSRDGTARGWIRRRRHRSLPPSPNDNLLQAASADTQDITSPSWTMSAVFSGHEGFVNVVLASRLDDGRQVVVTGSRDRTLLMYEIPHPSAQSSTEPLVVQPMKTFTGHTADVCSANAGTGACQGLIASGSWDGTAKLWDLNDHSGDAMFTLQGSDLSVWAVQIISRISSRSQQEIYTLAASADGLIRLYCNERLKQKFKGHSQPARALCILPQSTGDNVFASAGNDGQIKIWDWQTGDMLRSLDGHDSFAYSLTCTPDGTLISSGEDRSVRIWNKLTGDLDQVLTIPAISAWSVATIDSTNNDIAVGSSDGKVRIFTQDATRYAAASDLQAYDDLVSSSAITANQVGDVKKSDLPSTDTLLQRRGKKEGEIAMAKTIGGDVEAYQWTSANNSWSKIGQVVDAVGSGRKQIYAGKEYDYVFDVDVAEGQPPLKLPYNITQNPYEAAEKFLIHNNLPATYVDQVVQFIEKNTAGQTLGQQTESGGWDPYTGSSSYSGGVSRPSALANGSQAFVGDPWSRSNTTVSRSTDSAVFPHNKYLTFAQSNIDAAWKKLFELNSTLGQTTDDDRAITLDGADLITLQACVTSYNSSPNTFMIDEATRTILQKLIVWPSAKRFPALDIVRIFSLHAPISFLLPDIMLRLKAESGGPSKERATNSMLTLRAIANAFSSDEDSMIKDNQSVIRELCDIDIDELSKNGRNALATCLLNCSVLAQRDRLAPQVCALVFVAASRLLHDDDGETQYRALIALGNVLHTNPPMRTQIEPSVLRLTRTAVESMANSPEVRIRDVAKAMRSKW